MRSLFSRFVMGLMAAPLFVSIAMAQAGAAGENNLYNQLKNGGAGGPAPKHSVTGVWTGALEAKRPEVPQMTPLGQKLFSATKTEANTGSWADVNDPWKTCDPFGMPRSAVNEIRGISFAEMPDKIIVLHQYNRIWRDVWMDGRPLPKNVDVPGGPDSTWYGYSVGHWDGDYTLVIDTTGSDDSEWVDPRGYPHSAQGVFEERYTRVDHNHLEMTVTVNDPAIYTKPFVLGTSKFAWVPNQQSEEQICVPSQGIAYVNIISVPGARKAEPNK